MAVEAEAGINQLGQNPVLERPELRDVLGEKTATATNSLYVLSIEGEHGHLRDGLMFNFFIEEGRK